MDLSIFSSCPEWLSCAIVAAVACCGLRVRKSTAVLVGVVVALAWWFGTGKVLMLPVVLGFTAWALARPLNPRWWIMGRALAVAGSLATAVLCWLFPLPVPPPLPGPHGVGSFVFEMPAEGGQPRLLAQIWYPSPRNPAVSRSTWLPDSELAPPIPYHRLVSARTHSRQGVPPASGKNQFTVVFYEHSWMGHRAENIVQIENLVSRGFVVVAVDHPGQAKRVRYHDGSVVLGRYREPLDLLTPQGVFDFKTSAERCFTERIANVERVRHALQKSAGSLTGRLDLERVGVFGFSFGGSTAVRLCADIPAFRAGVNEDGFFLGPKMPAGPFLFFDQETPAWLQEPPTPTEGAGQLLTRRAEAHIQKAMTGPGREQVVIDGTRHLSFSDRIYSSPFPRLARTGTRPASEVHQILSERISGFFTKNLTARDDSKVIPDAGAEH